MQPSLFDDDAPQQQANVDIEPSWKEVLQDEFQKNYFQKLRQFIKTEKKKGKTIYPPGSLIFNAFNKTPFHKVKAVILGQDPYHGKGQAHGLCFSVPEGIKQPPSLKNILQELHNDTGVPQPQSGDLTPWAEQGVFLLNAILTVEAKKPASHRKKGWQRFTNTVIYRLSQERKGIIFLLWGNFAKDKQSLIDQSKHYILTAPHPSPYSAKYGFFGCQHFSQTNKILERQNKTPIDWRIE